MIIITGVAKGIGEYLRYEFVENEGWEVVGLYNNRKPITGNLSEPAGTFYKVDITNEDEIKIFVKSMIRDKGEVLQNIVLINCAGVNYNAIAHKADTASWINVINTNLIGTFLVIKNLLPLMRGQGYGRIINFSSVVAQKGVPGTSAYAASKSALWGLTKSIAVENVKKGITINNLNLGYHDIGMINQIPGNYRESIRKSIPAGEFGGEVNILNAVKFLMESEYVTGTSIDINGGLF